MDQNTENTIKSFFLEKSITSPTLIKGDFASTYTGKTVIYSAMYKTNQVIIKIYFNKFGTATRFLRELRVYQQLKNNDKLSQHIPKLLFFGNRPFRYLIIEKIAGEVLGNWRILEISKIKHVPSALEILTNIHRLDLKPRKLFTTIFSRKSYFFEKSRLIAASIVSMPEGEVLWDRFTKFRAAYEALTLKRGEGMIHGDFSPGNLIITPKEEVKVIDLETVSYGHIQYDLASFYFSSLQDEKVKKMLLENLESYFGVTTISNSRFLFNFYICWLIFHNLKLSKNIAPEKLVVELRLRIKLLESL